MRRPANPLIRKIRAACRRISAPILIFTLYMFACSKYPFSRRNAEEIPSDTQYRIIAISTSAEGPECGVRPRYVRAEFTRAAGSRSSCPCRSRFRRRSCRRAPRRTPWKWPAPIRCPVPWCPVRGSSVRKCSCGNAGRCPVRNPARRFRPPFRAVRRPR